MSHASVYQNRCPPCKACLGSLSSFLPSTKADTQLLPPNSIWIWGGKVLLKPRHQFSKSSPRDLHGSQDGEKQTWSSIRCSTGPSLKEPGTSRWPDWMLLVPLESYATGWSHLLTPFTVTTIHRGKEYSAFSWSQCLTVADKTLGLGCCALAVQPKGSAGEQLTQRQEEAWSPQRPSC